MRKNLLLVFLILLSLASFPACIWYPSAEQVEKSRSQIKSIPFERNKWFDEKGIGVESLWEDRPGLARDLVKRGLLIGKSVSEIQDLLGEEKLDEFTNSISYETYVDNGVVDPVFIESLVINFDEQGKVNNAGIQITMLDGHPDYRDKSKTIRLKLSSE